MFQKIILFRLERLIQISREIAFLFELLKSKNISLDHEMAASFGMVIEYAKKYNDQELLKQFQSWQSTITLVGDNINPYTLEDIKFYKNKTRQGVYYRVLNEANNFLLIKENELKSILAKANELTAQMILASFQLEFLKDDDIRNDYNQADIYSIWNKIKTSDQVRIFQYNILLIVGEQDALEILKDGMKMLKEIEPQ